jgi:hypothetical protein
MTLTAASVMASLSWEPFRGSRPGCRHHAEGGFHDRPAHRAGRAAGLGAREELRRLRALARIASQQELAEAEEAARIEELDALEASGETAELSDLEARRILGISALRGDEKSVTTDEVRRRLGLPR